MDIHNIYNNNYEYINNNFIQKNRAYGTLFEKNMVNLWICGGDLVTNKIKKNNLKYENITLRININDMEFNFKNGYLVSNFLRELGCKTYKFKCFNDAPEVSVNIQ